MNFLLLLAKYAGIFQELLPVAHIAVSAVQAFAPPGTPGADKFKAAEKAVNDTINAATAATDAFVQTKAAIAGGDSAAVGATLGHSIEVALSVMKTFKIAPKAGIVQNAADLPDVAGAAVAALPGGPGSPAGA